MTSKTRRVLAALAAATLVAAACGDDDDSDTADSAEPAATSGDTSADTAATETSAAAPATSAATEDTGGADTTAATEDTGGADTTEATEDGGGSGWTVNTDDCVDPDRANEPIEGTISIASAGPQSGSPAAAAFAPVIAGVQAYIDYANENQLLEGYEITITYGDDQYDPGLTPGVINDGLDAGAHLVSSVIGTPPNYAIRDTLNEECVPQLIAATGDPGLNDPAEYPWTIGGNLPYDTEAAAYAENVGEEFPDGATAALFYVNNEAGQSFADGFEEVAGDAGIEIVDDQTIEAAETAPPTGQVSSIADNAPDVIVAFPLGAQCPTFLGELANAKAANAGWEPRVYLTNTCASPLILGIAGETANGIFTSVSSGVVDVNNPENQSIPGVAEYMSYIEAQGIQDTVPTSVAGWIYGEVTVEILRQAAESPDGLTQASIMNAARNFEYSPSVVREGVVYKTSGEEDGIMLEDVQIVQYDSATTFFTDIGELNTSFRSS